MGIIIKRGVRHTESAFDNGRRWVYTDFNRRRFPANRHHMSRHIMMVAAQDKQALHYACYRYVLK